jgi:hypothetical protein
LDPPPSPYRAECATRRGRTEIEIAARWLHVEMQSEIQSSDEK